MNNGEVMKKWIIHLVSFSIMIGLTGCTTAAVRETMTFETVHVERDNKNSLKELILEKNDRMTKLISKSWKVEGADEGYIFSPSGGVGEWNVEGEIRNVHFICGFDEHYNHLLYISEDESGEEEIYQISFDETSYRLNLEPLEGNGEKKLLTPPGLRFLDTKNEKVIGLIGTWREGEDGYFELTENNEFILSNGSKGKFYVVEKEGEEKPEIAIVMQPSDYKFDRYEYTLWEDGNTLHVRYRDVYERMDFYRYWRRKVD